MRDSKRDTNVMNKLLDSVRSDQIRSVAQSCPTLCDPMNCRPPGSSVHGIFQARVLEWGAIPALNTLPHASNLDWRSISHMIIYMFQCYSVKSSHPHLLLQSPTVCCLHLCLFFCLTYKVIVTIFLNSIYMH